MRTQYVASIEIDEDRLAKDLQESTTFLYSEAYSNYLIGGPWKSAMLYATGGDTGDGLLTDYDYAQQATFTEYGRRLPYLQELITETADLSRLTFVRLARFAKSVIVPHRDYIELGDIPEGKRSAHRLHIPLATNEQCFFSEDNTVYRMRAGEVWYFDASHVHAVASFSEEPRVHLIFDFADRPGAGSLVTLAGEPVGAGIPERSAVARPPLSENERAALDRLAPVLTMDTFSEVFSILVKTHFRRDGGEDFAWAALTALAHACPDPDVLPHVQELRHYFTLERPSGRGQS